jgi:NAD(P)-dependent dehydrogenase (short-subunit alcohol dehydrogenase family)
MPGTAFVTGASYGIGQACALALARDGFHVAVSELDPADLADTVAKIEATGARALRVALDLRSQASIEQAMRDVLAGFGQLDVLVNSAGVPLNRQALEMTPEEWDAVLDVNLKGTFFMSQQMGRHLVATRRGGSIISVASTHGVVGFPRASAYGISKAGVSHMTRMLAIEWAEHGIRVNAIAPGTVETPSRKVFFDADPARRQVMIERIPLKRFGTAEEMAGAVAYLASPQGAYITGQTLLLDGGLTAY